MPSSWSMLLARVARRGALAAGGWACYAAAPACRADVFQLPEGLQSLETVVVGDPGNPPDDNGRGAVAYRYRIGKFEVTSAQYVEFLNAKGRAEPDGGLWFNDMDPAQGEGVRCGISRSGSAGSFVYAVAPEFANRPVTYASFWDACRFCNWLHNGQGDGDAETGAYDLRGYDGRDGRRVHRNPQAKWFLPTEDEWYKAAYYDPRKPGGAGYWDYPTRSDARPGRDFASANAANFYDGGLLDPQRHFTAAGAFSRAPSGYGTLDQAGNAAEWTEGLDAPFLRRLWGGAMNSSDGGRNEPTPNLHLSSQADAGEVGFRVAGIADEALPPGVAASPADPRGDATDDFPRRPWRDPQTGRPFFPLGWYVYDSDAADLDELARNGANLALFINSHSNLDSDEELATNVARMREYLDAAHERGIKVQVQLASWFGAFQNGNQAEVARQQKWVEALRDHPALFGYQLYDEPEYRARGGLGVDDQQRLDQFVDALRRNREALRTWDRNPHRMCQVVFNLVPLSSWTAYLPTVDSFQVDRYPCDAKQAYFGHQGDWGPLMMAWSMAHGARALKDHAHLRNPTPCMQGVGWNHAETGILGLWRDPLYEETRYMAYSSLTVGSWGVFHWIRNMGMPNSPAIMENVARLHAELRELLPAFEHSYERPPFAATHDHDEITRDFLTDCIADVTTLGLEDDAHYYLIVACNSPALDEVALRMRLPRIQGTAPRQAVALNEHWRRELRYDEASQHWVLTPHPMCFGDVNIWKIRKAEPLPERGPPR